MTNVPLKNDSESPYVTWTMDLAIGHDLIDADHRHIFEIANRLQAELLEAEEPEYSIVGEVLFELIEHTGSHFMREEGLMQAIGYSRYQEHKLEHDLMMNRVNDLHRQFMDGRRNVSMDVADFLRKWLVRHIMTSDMELGRSIRPMN